MTKSLQRNLPACLSEWQVTHLVEDNEVQTVEIFRGSALLPVACFSFKAIDQINYIEETSTHADTNECTRNCNGQMGFYCSRAIFGFLAIRSKVVESRLNFTQFSISRLTPKRPEINLVYKPINVPSLLNTKQKLGQIQAEFNNSKTFQKNGRDPVVRSASLITLR